MGAQREIRGRALPHGPVAPGFASLTRATPYAQNDIYGEKGIYEERTSMTPPIPSGQRRLQNPTRLQNRATDADALCPESEPAAQPPTECRRLERHLCGKLPQKAASNQLVAHR
jgi:hypothetical protein